MKRDNSRRLLSRWAVLRTMAGVLMLGLFTPASFAGQVTTNLTSSQLLNDYLILLLSKPSGYIAGTLYRFPVWVPFSFISGSDGNFYGVTTFGGSGSCQIAGAEISGTTSCGTVFRITPDGQLTTLHDFQGADDGSFPIGLIQGSDGNFYGFTGGIGMYSGALGTGTFFKMTPSGDVTTLTRSLSSPSGLIEGNDGNFYGLSAYGGSTQCSLCSSVFRATSTGEWTNLYVFPPSSSYVSGSFIQGRDGNIYGSLSGITSSIIKVALNGDVAVIYPTAQHPATADVPSPKISFQDSNGDLYGSSVIGGPVTLTCRQGCGTVFKMSSTGDVTPICRFKSLMDGTAPTGLILGSDGNLYGATYSGGFRLDACPDGCGTIFKMTPDGKVNYLKRFTGSDGKNPGTPIQTGDGSLYGAMDSGSAMIYKLSKP